MSIAKKRIFKVQRAFAKRYNNQSQKGNALGEPKPATVATAAIVAPPIQAPTPAPAPASNPNAPITMPRAQVQKMAAPTNNVPRTPPRPYSTATTVAQQAKFQQNNKPNAAIGAAGTPKRTAPARPPSKDNAKPKFQKILSNPHNAPVIMAPPPLPEPVPVVPVAPAPEPAPVAETPEVPVAPVSEATISTVEALEAAPVNDEPVAPAVSVTTTTDAPTPEPEKKERVPRGESKAVLRARCDELGIAWKTAWPKEKLKELIAAKIVAPTLTT